MTAHVQMRAMLDQLMGTGRNGETSRYQVQYSDPIVCKNFLLNCCPHDILASTRMDIGKCPKIHDIALRTDFEKAQQTFDHYYDVDVTEYLLAFISDCNRKTEAAQKRLLKRQEEINADVVEKAIAVHGLEVKIRQTLAKAEELNARGLVDDNLKLMGEIEELRKKKSEAEDENSMSVKNYQKQTLRVCEVCKAYLGIYDSDQRLAVHFGGKLHLGFIKIREKLTELEKNYGKRHEARRKFYEQERIKRDDKRSHQPKCQYRNNRHRRSGYRSHCSGSRTHKHDRRSRDRQRHQK